MQHAAGKTACGRCPGPGNQRIRPSPARSIRPGNGFAENSPTRTLRMRRWLFASEWPGIERNSQMKTHMHAAAAFVLLASLGAGLAAPTVSLVRTPDGGIQPQAAVDVQGTLHLIYY